MYTDIQKMLQGGQKKKKKLVLSGVELKLTEQRKMVRREMRIGAANYLALFQPVCTDGAKQADWIEKVSTVEYVVDDSLEFVCVIGELHWNVAVCMLQVELVYQLGFAEGRAHAGSHGCTKSCQESLVAVILQVWVVYWNPSIHQILHHT